MSETAIELHTVEYTKSDLARVPIEDRVFFLTITSLVNDLQTLYKQIAVAIDHVHGGTIVNQGNSTVGILNIRMMAGRIWEGWTAISRFSKRLRSDYEPQFSAAGKASIAHIRGYFPQQNNVMNKLRNKMGFHADPALIDQAFQALPDDADMGDYLNRTIGNTLFYSCEMLHYQALSEITGITDPVDALHAVTQELWSCAEHINSFAYAFVNTFYWKYLRAQISAARKGEPERLEAGVLDFEEMKFAYFARMPV